MPTVGRPSQHAGGSLPAFIQFPYQEVVWQRFMTDTLRKQYKKYYTDAVRRDRDPQDVRQYFLKKCHDMPTAESGFPPHDPTWQPPSTTERQQASFTQEDLARELATLVIQCNPTYRNAGTTAAAVSSGTTAHSAIPPGTTISTTTPWIRSQSTSQQTPGSESRPRNAPSHSPTISILSNEHLSESVRASETPAPSSPPRANPGNSDASWRDQDEIMPVLANPNMGEVEAIDRLSPVHSVRIISPPVISERVHTLRPSQASSDPPLARLRSSSQPSNILGVTTETQATAHASSGNTEALTDPVAVAATLTRPRRQRQANPDTVLAADVHRVIQTVTAFHCDCQDGNLQAENASRHGFSLREMCRDTGARRCFPLPGEQLPRAFAVLPHPSAEHLRADLSRLDYAQYLSTHPQYDLPRTPLRLRSTTTFADPLEDSLDVTLDIDSVWLRLNELSDVRGPINLAYTAQRQLNINTAQYVPHFHSDNVVEPPLDKAPHTVFAKMNFSACTGRVYVYWPHLTRHNKGVVNDQTFAEWVDGVVIPALQVLPSHAWQDHPKSFRDALAKASHRRETQIQGTYGVAMVEYTLSARFIPPFVDAMRAIVATAGPESSVFQFRSFSFVVMIHNIKRALNSQFPRFAAFEEFQRLLALNFQPSFLDSDAFLDRSFADFGVEYNINKRVVEPTTLMIRRTCLQHRLSTALLEAGGGSYAKVDQPEIFTSYGLYDAGTGRAKLPARTPASSIMPMIKAYSLYKHTHHSHFRDPFSNPFTLPHLDLLCLSDELLHSLHKLIAGSFRYRTVENIRRTLLQTLERLEGGQQANATRHTGVRIEPRISLRYLFGLLEVADNWPSVFSAATLRLDRRHDFVFAISTADLSLYIQNFLQRMTVALAAQQFDLFGPTPAWDSVVVRHRLGTTAVLLKIMANFWEGDEHKHQYMRATKYRPKKNRRVELVDEDMPTDLTVATMNDTDHCVRVGLMTDTILPRYGCYWLPTELFDFEPRVQLKLHLLHRITPTRPRLLSKARMNWRVPIHSRLTYQGDAVFALVHKVARDLQRLPPMPEGEVTHFVQRTTLRMYAWQLWEPLLPLLARCFFQYVVSLIDKDPHFLPVESDAFDVPFHALTYDVVSQLLGEEPTLVAPREAKGAGYDTTSWESRICYLFDTRSDDQWQKTAPYIAQLRQWLQIFVATGVHQCYLKLWEQDLGYLMRPFIWILPSCEKKTLFRLDKAGAQLGEPKRVRTRWHLLGISVKSPTALIRYDRSAVPRFQITEGYRDTVDSICRRRLEQYDSYNFAIRTLSTIRREAEIAKPGNFREEFETKLLDDILDFEHVPATWFHDRINSVEHDRGRWVPFWACGHEFPTVCMQELFERLQKEEDRLAPEGGFHSFVEASADHDDDSDDEQVNGEIGCQHREEFNEEE